ncbi:MAG: energy-coupling factor transporter ATPase [Firmicutes bacterium]|nr:energy-coupling factor transporter ATPase [Bacillota bacterium]
MSEEMVRSENLTFTYAEETDETEENPSPSVTSRKALDGIDLTILRGQMIVILGHNGSGKSTFAKMLNALLKPTGGSLWVDGIDTSDDENLWTVRQTAGMIFQNPDNQMIASIVEEDVAFGPENLGVDPEQIRKRVDESLKAVGMEEYVLSSPTHMSGGQKQRIAIAGILAMKPELIVLDEPTAMLDPRGRAEVMKTLKRLNQEEKITIIHITHYMEEAVMADQLYVIDQGKIALSGTPREVFSQVEKMRLLGLDVPPVTELAHELQEPQIREMLQKKGIHVPGDVLSVEEMVEALCRSN